MSALGAARGAAAAALLGVSLVGACGWVEWPPPGSKPRAVYRPPAAVVSAAPPAAEAPAAGAETVTAGPADTIYTIARRHRVAVRALIDANRLQPPYALAAGQRLVLPRGQEHLVRAGDTLYGISRLYGVDSYALAQANGLDPPYTIVVGQRLAVPLAARPAAPEPAAEALAVRPPAVETEVLEPPPPAGAGTPPLAVLPPPQAGQPPAAAAAPPPRSGRGFIWPLKGQVVAAFGPQAKGLHNDGINIAAPLGAPVRAAESGVVAYAGNELRGFGNLLLIKHADGYVTAYAHNRELLVKAGDAVRRGQVISRVGDSGGVGSPQLHFELRRGKRAVDPQKYLSDGSA